MSKIVNSSDIINDILTNIAPRYFNTSDIDKNRTSVFGYVTETMAKSIDDTMKLEQSRSEDYCPELSSNAMHVRESAKLRGIDIEYAIPAHTTAAIGVLKYDILNKGVTLLDEVQFTINRRSIITNNGISFSLEDDILIRAVKNGSSYVYTANYSGVDRAYNSYIQTFEDYNDVGDEILTLVLTIYQIKYNIQEKTVTDELEFLYEGLEFTYQNKLADFDVYFKQGNSETFKKVDKKYYLTNSAAGNFIYFNDDTSNVLYILNNTLLGININADVRVEFKETLGSDGISSKGVSDATFELYRDNSYNYSGINIIAELLDDVVGASNGDDLMSLRTAMIRAKTTRNNITTTLDIINYINDSAANVQIIKKRNDIQDRIYNLYTLIRIDDAIVPATTKKLIVADSNFNIIHASSNRKGISSNSKFLINTSDDTVTMVKPGDAISPDGFYLNCPFLIFLNSNNVLSYYFNSINKTMNLNTKIVNDSFSYQIICNKMQIVRNVMSNIPNRYLLTFKTTLNTSNDLNIVNDKGEIIDADRIIGYVIFKNNSLDTAYLPIKLESYDKASRIFTFGGWFETNDFITESEKLHITKGMYRISTVEEYDSVIDYNDGLVDVYFMYKDETMPKNVTTNAIYNLVPKLSDYIWMNVYCNSNDKYDLIVEMNKYSRSSVITKLTAGGVSYEINEVPFIKYDYAKTNILKIYQEIVKMNMVYTSMIKRTTDFNVNLKFTSTYGNSKHILLEDTNLNNLNPVFKFKVYGTNIPVDSIKTFIHDYLRDTYIINSTIFISNICTLVESKFNIKSIKYLGVDNFNAAYQQLTYREPDYMSIDSIKQYIPEQLNVENISIEIDES